MTFINYNTREINFKIIYYGPAGSGKTRNLQYIFENTSGEQKGEMIRFSNGGERTCYFDFLPVFLGKIRGYQTRLHLYTVPGGVLHDTQRNLLFKGLDGIVFVADSRPSMLTANQTSLNNLHQNLAAFRYRIESIPHVFQFNRRDADEAVPVEELALLLNKHQAPEFAANAKAGEGVLETLKRISGMVLSNISRNK